MSDIDHDETPDQEAPVVAEAQIQRVFDALLGGDTPILQDQHLIAVARQLERNLSDVTGLFEPNSPLTIQLAHQLEAAAQSEQHFESLISSAYYTGKRGAERIIPPLWHRHVAQMTAIGMLKEGMLASNTSRYHSETRCKNWGFDKATGDSTAYEFFWEDGNLFGLRYTYDMDSGAMSFDVLRATQLQAQREDIG